MSQFIQDHLAAGTAPAVMPGAEPFFLRAGDTACLLLHGWGGSCQTVHYLGERLFEAGITVYAPLLPGHGTSPENMARTDAADWAQAAVHHLHALTDLYASTFVVGISLGAVLTLYLGATQGEHLKGIVSINGPLYLNNPDLAALALQADGPDMLPAWPEGLLKDPAATEVTYSQVPRNTLLGLFGIMKIAEELLPTITVPALVLQSKEDGIVPCANAEVIYARLGSASKHLTWLDNSYHVATIDYDKDRVAAEITAFVRDYA